MSYPFSVSEFSKKISKGLIISDFTVDHLRNYLENDALLPAVLFDVANAGTLNSMLTDPFLDPTQTTYDMVLTWIRIETAVPSFGIHFNDKSSQLEQLFKEVDEFCSLLKATQGRASMTLLPSWTIPTYHRLNSLLDLHPKWGLSNLVLQLNLRLAENLSRLQGFYLLNSQKWIESVGKNAYSPKLWYLGKIPYSHEVFKEAARDIKAALSTQQGHSCKLILVDLDHTLWGGLVGEVGWQGLNLGGHDPHGEAYVDFQKTLKTLQQRGVLLGIVSKNEEHTALEVFEKHPEMILRKEDFAGWRINWKDKAENVLSLASQLNLGLQSVLFLDDHPGERSRVKEALPEVRVPDMPTDSLLFNRTLLELGCFDTLLVTDEDLGRSDLYAQEQLRIESTRTLKSPEEWLKSLELKLEIELLNAVNLPRAVQLLNKTNQMNLSTRRLGEPTLLNWTSIPNRRFWTLRSLDRFGDSGLTGLLSVEVENDQARVVDFVLSCRVFGRKIENAMLALASNYCQNRGAKELIAIYLPTEKNKPCLDFLNASGMTQSSQHHCFTWSLDSTYPAPDFIKLYEKQNPEDACR